MSMQTHKLKGHLVKIHYKILEQLPQGVKKKRKELIQDIHTETGYNINYINKEINYLIKYNYILTVTDLQDVLRKFYYKNEVLE